MKIFHELYSPIINMPSKNYPFHSNMMSELPPWPIKKVCSSFAQIEQHNAKNGHGLS